MRPTSARCATAHGAGRRSSCGAPPRRTQHADRLGHPFSRAFGRVMQAIPLLLARAHHEASQSVREGIALGAREGMPAVLAIGRLFEALIESELGSASAERVERAVAAWEATGQRQFLGIARLFLADALEREGEEARALTLLEEECRRSAKQLSRYIAPELHRRRGELLARAGRSVEAESALRHALRSARAGRRSRTGAAGGRQPGASARLARRRQRRETHPRDHPGRGRRPRGCP